MKNVKLVLIMIIGIVCQFHLINAAYVREPTLVYDHLKLDVDFGLDPAKAESYWFKYSGVASNELVNDAPAWNESVQTPLVSNSGEYLVDSPESFSEWFTSTIDPIEIEIDGWTESGDNLYLTNLMFWPIDGKGHGNEGETHNYNWCAVMKFSLSAKYPTTPCNFSISNYFDRFVSVDGVVVASQVSHSSEIWNQGERYSINSFIPSDVNFYWCNRCDTSGIYANSPIIIEVKSCRYNCSSLDECGYCDGSCYGDIAKCLVVVECDGAYGCERSLSENPMACIEINGVCTSSSCVPDAGCTFTPLNCDDANPCTYDYCSESGNGCQHFEIEGCDKRCDCSDVPIDSCQYHQCDYLGNCFAYSINCTTSNPCVRSECLNGECVQEYIPGCVTDPTTSPSPTPEPTIPPTLTPISGCICPLGYLCVPGNLCIRNDDPYECEATCLKYECALGFECKDHPNGGHTCQPISRCLTCQDIQCSEGTVCDYIENCDNHCSRVPFCKLELSGKTAV